MPTIHIYLDKRNVKQDEPAPLKVGINKRGSSAYISLNIKVKSSQWDASKERIINHHSKLSLQTYIDTQKIKITNVMLELEAKGELTNLTATQVKKKVVKILNPPAAKENSFFDRYLAFSSTRPSQKTREIYMLTAKRMKEYDKSVTSLSFEGITKDWLNGFDRFLVGFSPSQNARSIHFRNIRAAFNDAIDNCVTTAYPFRLFKIKNEPTAKRSLGIEQVRNLFNSEPPAELQQTLDLFKLSFFLVGINITDMCNLSGITDDGRIVYKRQKTKKLYNIKVEPEALAIINKYRGEKHLLNILEHYKNVHSFTIMFDRKLKRLYKGLTSYYARHTWATIASELDVPSEVISHALGHSFSMGASVTQIYIDFNSKKIDEANRKVIDFVMSKS